MLIDLPKAFDSIQCESLIAKMHTYGFFKKFPCIVLFICEKMKQNSEMLNFTDNKMKDFYPLNYHMNILPRAMNIRRHK